MEFFLIFDHIIDYKLMAQLSLSKDYAKLNPKEQEKFASAFEASLKKALQINSIFIRIKF